MKAVILVGGEGTRLRPISLMMPKPVVPILNVPLMFYILEWLKKHGVDEAIMVACYLPEKLKKVLKNSYKGMKITYIYEDTPLGTGGAIKRAQQYMKGTTVVINGDIITDFNITRMFKFHKEKKSRATVGLYPVGNYSAFGVVDKNADGSIKRFLEKPSREEIGTAKANINAGVYLLEPEVLNIMDKGLRYSVERDVFPKLVGTGFFGFDQEDIYWLDLGTPERLRKFSTDILEKNYPLILTKKEKYSKEKGAKVLKSSLVGKGTKLGKNSLVGMLNVIGNNCEIGENTVLENCILFDNVKVGKGCVLKNSIICSASEIMDNVQISKTTVLGPGSIIAQYSKAGD
ncbi:MAG: NDP-sugar synthase [Candidatus Firestonebacteria bacterium]|nr:NDP-sugar synthase [Candidatus Firestonebacteria bacterium]